MITFALSSPNDAFTVIFRNEKTKDIDFKCSVVAQMGIIHTLRYSLCLPKPVASWDLWLKSRTFCAATGLRSYMHGYVCACVGV